MDVVTEEYSRKVYKKDTSGKIRILHVFTEGADVIQESGVIDGKLVQHRSTSKPKNIGKSNETTAEQQARSEAASKIENKMSTGYFDTEQEAQDNEVILPMLAKSYDNEAKKINWKEAVYVQPKLDGMRCLAIIKNGVVTLMSRKGKEIDTVPHINEAIGRLGLQDIMLDGELYAHGKTFQENMKLIKKYREGESEEVCYHMYDRVSDVPYTARYSGLSMIVTAANTACIKLVDCNQITSEDQIANYHSQYLALGYEGSIIRHGDAGYKVNGRSSNLLKYKDFIDIACKVIDVKPCDKRPTHGECVCEHDGHTFGTGMKFSHKDREKILRDKDKYIGQTAEIRFFEYTDDGKPRFPVCVGFRLDK